MCPPMSWHRWWWRRLLIPTDTGERRRIVAAYLDPANFKEIGDGHTIADQINEVFEPWDIVLRACLE